MLEPVLYSLTENAWAQKLDEASDRLSCILCTADLGDNDSYPVFSSLVRHIIMPGCPLYRLAENAWAQKLEEASETLTHRAALDHVRRVAAKHVEQTDDKGVSWEIDAFFVDWANSPTATQVLQDLLMVSLCHPLRALEVPPKY